MGIVGRTNDFHVSKSLVDLGGEFQGLSYDMTVSSTTITFTRYIILEWLRRNNDQKTICELFYVCCDDIQNMELSIKLKQLLRRLCGGIKKRAITLFLCTNSAFTGRSFVTSLLIV